MKKDVTELTLFKGAKTRKTDGIPGKNAFFGTKAKLKESKAFRIGNNLVKNYSKKLQKALAIGKIKWYIIHKPNPALFCVVGDKRDYKFLGFIIVRSKGETT